MATYLIGIDFGDGDTTATAWLIGEDRRVRVRFRDTDKEDDYKIRSVIYRKEVSKGIYDYKLEDAENYGYVPYSSFKKKVKELSEEGKDIFKHFIQRAYQAMLENNPFGKDGNDFLLYVAAPTSWDEAEKEEYRRFVEEAIGKRVEWVISESDAAYYNKASDKEQNWVLVVDYGSSTIDFTLMCGKEKINVDFLSCRMGARSIEQKLYEAYKETSKYKESLAYFNKKLEEAGKDPIDPAGFLRLGWRKGKEHFYSENKSKLVLDEVEMLKQYANILLGGDAPEMFFYHSVIAPESAVYSEYIAEVKGYFAYVKNRLSQPDYLGEEGMKNLKVICTGGASRMPWVRAELERLFGQGSVFSKEKEPTEASNNYSNVEKDDRPEYVVSDGVVKYAKLLYEVEQEVNKVMDEVMGNIGTLQAEVEQNAREAYKNIWEQELAQYEAINVYRSDKLEEFTVEDNDQRNKHGNYYSSSYEYLVQNILSDSNSNVHEEINQTETKIGLISNVQEKMNLTETKREISNKLTTSLKEAITKLIPPVLKKLNLGTFAEDIEMPLSDMPDVNNIEIPSKIDYYEAVVGELVEGTWGENTKFGKEIIWGMIISNGSYRKRRKLSERTKAVETFKNSISSFITSYYKPYSVKALENIQQNIYNAILKTVKKIVQEHLMFDPCGYDMEKRLRDSFGMLITTAQGKEVFGHSYEGIAPKEGDVVYCKDKDGVVKSSTVCSFRQVPTGTYYMLLAGDALAGCEGCWCYTK